MIVLHQTWSVERDDYAHAGDTSMAIKSVLSQVGIPAPLLRRIGICCYEAEINMIIHAYGGVITLDVDDQGHLQLVFRDPDPGIADISLAMTPGWSTASEKAREMGFGAGMGLVNIKDQADTFDLQSSPAGTILTIGFQVNG